MSWQGDNEASNGHRQSFTSRLRPEEACEIEENVGIGVKRLFSARMAWEDRWLKNKDPISLIEFISRLQSTLSNLTAPAGSHEGRDLAADFIPIKEHLLRVLENGSGNDAFDAPVPIRPFALENLSRRAGDMIRIEDLSNPEKPIDAIETMKRVRYLGSHLPLATQRGADDPPVSSLDHICQLPVKLAQARLLMAMNGLNADTNVVRGVDQLQTQFRQNVTEPLQSRVRMISAGI